LADVCRALDISNVTDVKNRLKKDGVVTIEVIDTLGRLQNVNAINESNLYKTIFQSRKEEALQFQDWVTSEVLPAIRKHGAYATADTLERMIANPDFAISLLETLKTERTEKEKALAKLDAQRPLVTYAETVSTAINGATLREWIGMMKQESGLQVSERKVISFLIEKKFLYRNKKSKLIPHHDRFDYFSMEPIVIATPKGNVEYPSLKITGKGQVLLTEKIVNHFNN
jgi:prophage antirepressor-like protein